MATPATYCIRVQGALGTSWSEHLGAAVTVARDEVRQPVTELVGRVEDQAALLGILDILYRLGFPLLSITCLEIEMVD